MRNELFEKRTILNKIEMWLNGCVSPQRKLAYLDKDKKVLKMRFLSEEFTRHCKHKMKF